MQPHQEVRLQPAAPMFPFELPEFLGWDMPSISTRLPDKLSQRAIISQGFARVQAEMYRVKECIDDNLRSAHHRRMSTIEYNTLARQHNRYVAAFDLDRDLIPLKNIRTSIDIWPFPLRIENISKHRPEMLAGVLRELGIDINTKNAIRQYIIYLFKKVIGVEVMGT